MGFGRSYFCSVNSLETGFKSLKSPKLSRKPRRSVVSVGENRSAEDGNGGGSGNILESDVSNANSKSAKGTGGCREEWDIMHQCVGRDQCLSRDLVPVIEETGS